MAQQNEKDNVQMMNDVFEAVSLIAAKQIEHLEFDKTLKCQIIDDSNKELGEYTVTDGVTDFVAYSENQQLRAGNWVFVTVPNNDFSQQKFITGKYTTDESEYYTYVNPMETYINITGNLNTSDNTWKLVANHEAIKEVEIFRMGDVDPQSNASIDSSSHMLAGFDRLGIQADFRSELGQYDIVSGHYGINVRVKSFTPSVVKMNDSTTEEQGYFKWTKFSLDSSDMFGNPYDFFIQTTQQVVFDITHLGEIVGILVTFYQSNDFLTRQKRRIPIINASENAEEAKEVYYNRSNLFASNVNVSLGYDLSNFEDDTLLLTTFDSPIYSYVAGSDNTQNIKHLSLRWIHRDENDNLIPIDEFQDIPLDEEGTPMIDIHWYKWKFANNVEDELAGTFWEEISDIEDPFQYNLNPSNDVEEERVKVIIQSPSEAYIASLVENAELDKDSEISQEQQRVEYERDLRSEIILYTSNILDFTNEQEAPNIASVNLIRGLSLLCDPDGGNGVYRIYDSYGQLLNKNEGSKERKIMAHFSSVVLRDESIEPTYDVTWYIPAQQTMIVPPDACKTESQETTEDEEQIIPIKPYSDPELSEDGKYYIIRQTRENMVEQATEEDRLIRVEFEIPFKIKNFYNKLWNNNTIQCKILRNGTEYKAESELLFSTASSNGTEYALAADFFDGDGNNLGAPIFYIDKANFVLKIVPHVFDNNGIEITNDAIENNRIQYRWYSTIASVNGFNLSYETDENNHITNGILTAKTGASGADFYNCVVAVTVSRMVHLKRYEKVEGKTELEEVDSSKEVSLTEYIPISICFDSAQVQGLIGDNRIIYNSNGTNPQYYKSPYQLVGTTSTVEWSMHLNKDEQNKATVFKYYPQISKETGELTVPPIFMSNNQSVISILASIGNNVIWCQPLYIAQDVYASKFLNTWDGQLTVDEDNNRIMAALIGAGFKNDDNTFSGVLMGDVAGHGDISSPLGLYGYEHGEQSYGFKIDGSAFIGKQGTGRIYFNERDGGIIESGNYSSSNKQAGMHIDLVNGKIEIPLQGENSIGQSILLDGSSSTTRPFGIGELLYLKSDGSLYVKGEVHATNGTFTGSLDGFSGHFGHGTQGNAQTRIDLDVNADGYAYIQSGQHLSWDSNKLGFYLSGEGLSIGSHFYVDSDGNVTATSLSLGDNSSNFYDGIWNYFGNNLDIYIKKDNTLGTLPASGATESNTTGFQVSTQGLLQASNAIIWGTIYASNGVFSGTVNAGSGRIGNNDNKQIVIGTGATTGYGYIRSNAHTGLSSEEDGFWLAENGLSIGSRFSVDRYGNVEIKQGSIIVYDKANEGSSTCKVDLNGGVHVTNITSTVATNISITAITGEFVKIYPTYMQLTDKRIDYSGEYFDFNKKINCTAAISTERRFESEYIYNNPASNGGTANLFINSNGYIFKTSDSSQRYKENIENANLQIFNPHGLYKLAFRQFRYKKGYFGEDAPQEAYDKIRPGFIAEEVYEHYPAAAVFNENKEVETWSERELVPPMLVLIQEQHKEIEQLKQQVEALINK